MLEKRTSAIANFSLFFVKRSRISILIILGVLLLGFFAYNSFLKREGFPPVQVPIVFIQTPYFVEDQEKVDQDITTPIEKAISHITEINKVTSTTTENFSFVMVEFNENFPTEDGRTLLIEEIEKDTSLPANAKPEYLVLKADAIDGKHDLIFTISDDRTLEELQLKADEIAGELESLDEVAQANVIELVSEEVNPQTGQKINYQSGFNRVGIKKDGDITFSEAVAIGVIKKGDIGTLELSKAVRDEIMDLKSEGQLDNVVVNFGGDFADSLNDQIDSLEENAISGFFIVTAIIFLFIGWRSSLVIALFIPLVSAATFFILYLIGYTLNVIVLFSLILVLGLVVDDAVVVVEAVDHQKRNGAKGFEAIKSAITNIGIADIAGTLTIILVFIPMLFVSGLLGDFIKLIPITIICAYSASLVLALSVTPFLSNIFIADKKTNRNILGFRKAFDMTVDFVLYGVSKIINFLSVLLGKYTKLTLQKWPIALLILVTTFIWIFVGIAYAQKLNFSIFPPSKDSDQINIFVSFPAGTTIENAQNISSKIEDIVTDTADSYIQSVNYFEGTREKAYINVVLTPYENREKSSAEIVDTIENSLVGFNEASTRVEQAGVGPPTDEFQLNTQVFAEDNETLEKVTSDLESYLDRKKIKTENSSVEVTETKIENIDNISKKDDKRFALVRAKISDTTNTAAILALQNEIKREYDKEKLEEFGLKDDAIGFDLGQEGENVQSFESTVVALGFALILMYILLVLVYDSLLQPLLIFIAIPLSFPGLFPGLYFTENSLSFFVMLGIIALSGIVVNNTIMLVDYANQDRKAGLDAIDSISNAISKRLRPILTTTTTSVLALLPLTLSEPFWESLGYTLIFGLISSSILVIFAFPVFYSVVEVIREVRNNIWIKFSNN